MRINNNNNNMNGVIASRGSMLTDLFDIVAMNNAIDGAFIYLNFGDHYDIMTYWHFFRWFELHTNMYGFVDVDNVYIDADGTANIAIEMHDADADNVDELD